MQTAARLAHGAILVIDRDLSRGKLYYLLQAVVALLQLPPPVGPAEADQIKISDVLLL